MGGREGEREKWSEKGREGGRRKGGRERKTGEQEEERAKEASGNNTRKAPKIKQLFDRVFERQQEQLCADAPPRPAT